MRLVNSYGSHVLERTVYKHDICNDMKLDCSEKTTTSLVLYVLKYIHNKQYV